MTEHETGLARASDKMGGCGKDEAVIRPIRMYVQWSYDDNDWCLDDNPSPNPKKKTKPILLDPGSGPRDIEFKLQPPPGLDWKFAAPADQAISTEDNCGCPPSNGLNSDQIQNVQFKNQGVPGEDRAVLIVTNLNNDAARLIRYKLHIVDETGAPLPDCDPAILNGGTGDN